MKRKILTLIGVLGLGLSIAQSQTYINSWEGSTEGWSAAVTNWASVGLSDTFGVMAGTNSWAVQNASGNFNWNQDGTQPDFTGPASVGLTTLLANGSAVSVDVTVPNPGDFGWGMGFSLYLNQPGGAGIMAISQWGQWLPSGGPLPTTTLTFTIPDSVRIAMRAHPGLATSLSIVTGSGNAGTMYLDGLRITPYGQINSWEFSYEGWTVVNYTNFAFGGTSETVGVTAGLYSLVVSNYTGYFNWNQDGTQPDFQGPSSTDLTALMAQATNVAFEVTVPNAGDFGWGCGFSLYLNQPGGGGIMAIPTQWQNWLPSGGPVPTTTFNFPVPQSVRTALLNHPTLPCYLSFCLGSGNAGTMYLDNLRAGLLPPVQASLWVREYWDDVTSDQEPATQTITDNSSSVGFSSTAPWTVNPAEVANCELMQFRSFQFTAYPQPGASTMGLPASLDHTWGCLVQQNNVGVSFFPGPGGQTFWTAGDFMTRSLNPPNFINFQAQGEYWFSMNLANSRSSQYAQYVTFPSSGAGGFGFADGADTNANFVAIGVTPLNMYLGPTNASYPYHGATNISKTLYISQGTLGQPGNVQTTYYNPLTDPSASPADPGTYSQTNFSGGPYYVSAYGTNIAGQVEDDGILLLGHLVTHGDGTATLDAKFYGGNAPSSSNNGLDMTTNIQWDCSYTFSYGGTMTKMLLFQNGQFPFYMYGVRASTNFINAVGLDPGRIAVSPLTATYEGYPINMTNLAVEANPWSWFTTPPNYNLGLQYQWYTNGVPIGGATSQYYNIASAKLTDAATYMSVATDPSGTWGSVTDSVAITVTHLNPQTIQSFSSDYDQSTYQVVFDQPNITGVGDTNNYSISGGVGVTAVAVRNNPSQTIVQLGTTNLPLGTRLTLIIKNTTNAVGDVVNFTNVFWTDLVQTGVANWNTWLFSPDSLANGYFNNWVPANPNPTIVQSMTLSSWEAPSSGVTNVGVNSYAGNDFGAELTGWFIPPVTTNYVFFISADDGARLSLSTNSSSANMFVIACESVWSGADAWTNYSIPSGSPNRGDGSSYVFNDGSTSVGWDNTPSEGYYPGDGTFVINPATADLQNRSDQLIVAYYDSTGLSGGPAGATNQAKWSVQPAASKVEDCVLPGTQFWPNRDAYGQALIHLQAGQKYYMKLEHMQQGGGYDASVTYKYAGQPDPASPSATIMTGSNIAGTVPFAPTVSITTSNGVPVITYTGVLYATTNLAGGVTNVVAQSSAATAISLGGPSQYSPPPNSPTMFYRTSK